MPTLASSTSGDRAPAHPPASSRPSRAPAERSSRSRAAAAIAAAGAVLVLAAGFVLVAQLVGRSEARFSGTTENVGSLFSTARIDLVVAEPGDPASTASLAIDVDNLYPGPIVERCVATTVVGSVDVVDLRLFGRLSGGTGLERFLDTTVETGVGGDDTCDGFDASQRLFDGTLAGLASDHDDWGSGLRLVESGSTGEPVTVRVTLQMQDDDRAQGLVTDFWLVVEARPA